HVAVRAAPVVEVRLGRGLVDLLVRERDQAGLFLELSRARDARSLALLDEPARHRPAGIALVPDDEHERVIARDVGDGGALRQVDQPPAPPALQLGHDRLPRSFATKWFIRIQSSMYGPLSGSSLGLAQSRCTSSHSSGVRPSSPMLKSLQLWLLNSF